MNKVAEMTSLAALNLSLQMDYTITYAVIASCYDTLLTQEQMISVATRNLYYKFPIINNTYRAQMRDNIKM